MTKVKFNKVFLDGRWVYAADRENVPYIFPTKNDEYITKMPNGKNKVCKTLDEAKKVALDTYRKYKHFKLD